MKPHPLFERSGIDTLLDTRDNVYRQWAPSPSKNTTVAARLETGERMYVHFEPSFALTKQDVVFTIGSCFARNVEGHLMNKGIKVAFEDFKLPADLYLSDDGTGTRQPHRGALNKYSTHSIYSDVEHNLLQTEYPSHGLIEVSEGQWFDPQASRLKPNTWEVSLDTRQKLNAVTRKLKESTAVFITLGLTETWKDMETGIVLNVPPPPLYIKKFKNRFQFFDADFVSSYENLCKTIALIRTHCNPEMRFIVTVSPVPLGATYTGLDVISANSYSKSTLRSVAQAVVATFPNIDYFPSYEMVINSPRPLAWEADQVHVKSEMVNFIMSQFVGKYVQA
jgi:hypothetical protein